MSLKIYSFLFEDDENGNPLFANDRYPKDDNANDTLDETGNGTGAIAGYVLPLGMDTEDARAKELWGKDKNKKVKTSSHIETKRKDLFEDDLEEDSLQEKKSGYYNYNPSSPSQSLMSKMGYEYAGRNHRLGSDTFVYKTDPQKAKSKATIKKVNKNLDKKPYSSDPPSMGISLPKNSKLRDRKA